MSQSDQLVLAIDPGERVGWAIGLANPPAGTEHGLVIHSQGVSPLKDFALALGRGVEKYHAVIYETWRLRPDMAKKMVGNDFQPSQLIGIIRYLAWMHPAVKLVSQGANIKKTALRTMPKDIKDRFALSSEQHDQDALMHLWHWYWRTHVIPNLGG